MAKKRAIIPVVGDHWHPVIDSGIISGCGIRDGKLTIAFQKNGIPSGLYQYTTDSTDLCCKMAMSVSKGQFFHSLVSGLPYARIG
jgi:hypothetical protein